MQRSAIPDLSQLTEQADQIRLDIDLTSSTGRNSGVLMKLPAKYMRRYI